MAEYTRYSVEPEDVPRRRRERKKKAAKSRSRAWLIVKLFIVALLLALRRRPRPAQVVGYPVLAAWMVASFFLELPMDYQSSGLVLITLAAALASDWSTPFVGHPEASGRPLGAGFPAASPASPRPARRLESG